MVNSGSQVKTGAWDPEEDDLLYYWQSKVGNKWSEVAKHIPGRTGQQCAQRWRHKVNPNIRRDKWTPEEDAKLIELVKTFGIGRWAEIARNCDGRTDQQCMGRWRRHLDPSIRRDGWTPEEDAKLRQLHAQYGTSWSRISKCLKGRTSQQCRARWHQINNGKGGSSKAAAVPTAASGDAANTGSNKRGAASSKRKPVRRRNEFTDSEEEEEPEDDEDYFEDDYEQEQQQQQQQYHVTDYAAHQSMAAAAAAEADEVPYSLDMPAPGTGAVTHLQRHEWNAAWAASAGHPCDDVAYGTDQEADDSAEEGASDVEHTPAAAAAVACMDHYSSSHGHQSTVAAAHSKGSSVPGGSQADLQQQQGDRMFNNQQLFLSPDRPPKPLQLQFKAKVHNRREQLDDEETAGAETLLQMAHLLRRESCEFEPPSLRRSDFITASTPPKRTIEERPEVHNSDELSPSPFKRARSSRGALFVAPAAAEQASSMAPARTARKTGVPCQDEAATQHDEEQASDSDHQQHGGCHDQEEPAADNYMDSEVDEHAEDELDNDASILGFGAAGGRNQALPHPARPSNASCLTAAGSTAAAAFLSPPPVPRVPGSSGRWHGGMITPRRPTAQQNLMNLLGSPSFDRMPGYASPPSAGKTQPSAATLAALQSPQPSCVHEPFWTPFTGLVKDGLFTRGTSATPDLATGGKGRGSAGGMFSPLRRSGSTGSKAKSRRSFLASPHPAERSDCVQSDSGLHEDSCEQHAGTCQDPGSSPACGLQQQVQQVHHRVVRRLDQHEAWGASSKSSPRKQHPAPRPKEGTLGVGFSLFSPVKKQPVPLFNEGSNVTVGVSPAKPSLHDVNLTIAPLLHHLPISSEQPSSPAREPVSHGSPTAVASMPYGRSPLGPKSAGRPPIMSSRRPSAARSLLSPVHSRILHKLQEQQQHPVQQRQTSAAFQATAAHRGEAEQQDGSPMAISPDDAQGAVQQRQWLQQQQDGDSLLVLEQQGSAFLSQPESEPDTPVHLKQGLDTTSCSGTPNTPAEQQVLSGLMGVAAPPSPGDFVTPQQRLRPSRPLAPLHKDCLIAAATRTVAAAGGAAPASQAPPAAAAGDGRSAVTAADAPSKTAATPAKAAVADAGTSDSAPGSADSSKLLSPDSFMDSPLQVAIQQLQSPSQWHQGMVMLMHNLQQTPLQVNSLGDGDSVISCGGKTAGEAGVVRAGSRALRRLEAELERGSSAAAAVQQHHRPIDMNRGAGNDVDVPFSTAAVQSLVSPSVAPACAPMLLPLFNSVVPAHSSSTPSVTAPIATPVGLNHGGAVASVSLTPAVINCSKADVLAMQGPGAATVAWPVQQRPDGGLVMTATPVDTAAAASMLQLTPPAVPAAKPLSTSDKENASGRHSPLAGSGPAAEEPTAVAVAVAAINSTQPGVSGSRMTVVSIQPVTMVTGSSQPAQLTAVQPLHSVFQALPTKSLPDRFVNSHAVRSRLHALIDSVQ